MCFSGQDVNSFQEPLQPGAQDDVFTTDKWIEEPLEEEDDLMPPALQEYDSDMESSLTGSVASLETMLEFFDEEEREALRQEYLAEQLLRQTGQH